MSTSRGEIRGWLDTAKKDGATHVIVCCDTYEWSDYPVVVRPGEDPRKKADGCNKDMQKVMEVYALHLPLDPQLNEYRSFHYERESGWAAVAARIKAREPR